MMSPSGTLVHPTGQRQRYSALSRQETRTDLEESHSEFAFRQHWPIWRPLLFLVCVSVLIRWQDWDRAVAGYFFDARTGAFVSREAVPWRWIYQAGIYPALVLGIGGLCVALFSRFFWRLKRVERGGLFLFLLLVLGPGLLINTGLKHFWGRPRPHEIQEFGGDRRFLAIGEIGAVARHNSSFPSGHAGVAFYLMAPAFLISPRFGAWRVVALGIGIFLGFGMGLTRVVQGGHFLSDVIWSGGLVYLTGAILARQVLTGVRVGDGEIAA